MGYYSELDIDLKSDRCFELHFLQNKLNNPQNSEFSMDLETMRDAIFALINERKELHADDKDLMVRLYKIDALIRKQQRRLLQEADRYVQLSLFDSTIINSH